MRWYEEVIIVLAFWVIYGPFSLVLWYETGKQEYGFLVLVFLIGAVLVFGYLAVSAVLKKRTPRTRLRLRDVELEEYDEDEPEDEPDFFEGFRQIFGDGGDAS